MTTITESKDHLRITRMYSAMRERVFRAWTDATELRRWWHAGETFAPSLAEVDARVGGRFRLGMTSPADGKQTIAEGIYRDVKPAEKLVFTWRCEDDPVQHETLVTVEFFDHGKNTELVLLHEGFMSREECEQYGHYWNASLAELATLLHDIETPPIELCVEIAAPEEKVFHALTDADQLMRWFPTMVENDPVPGGKFTFTWEFEDDPSRNHMRCGEYTEVIPYKSVVHTWDARPKRELREEHPSVEKARPTVVEFRLTPEDSGGTRVMLIHSGWESGPEWQELKDSHLRGWTFFLANLKSHLETGTDDRAKEMGMKCAEVIQGVGY